VRIGLRLGIAVASGVPVLVLVSMGSVAGLVGTPSVLVWGVSAGLGFFMSTVFAELAGAFPTRTGGIGVLAGAVLAPASRPLALLAQWSYWFGWSPALAINSVLVGTYLQAMLWPWAPPWAAVAIAAAILTGSAVVNHYGIRPGAWTQVGLAVAAIGGIGILVGGAVLRGGFDPARLLPFSPPGGWTSRQGLVALTGALFIAGWSAYGSELALSYGAEYRCGTRTAANAAVLVALASVVAYTVIPLVMLGVLGTTRVAQDPAVGLAPLAHLAVGGEVQWVVGLLAIALVLGLNMVMLSSSRGLYQMARSGDAWSALGRLNRRGVPANALRFDLAVNLALLAVSLVIGGGRTASIPIVLLAASSVGYFTSICLALVAVWLNHARPGAEAAPDRLVLRDGMIRGALALAVLNAALLAFAGFAWGWDHVGLGVAVIIGAMIGFTRRRAWRAPHQAPEPEPVPARRAG
jgi:amino acid transporter